MDTVSVRKIKRPDGTSLWRGYVVANDEFGTWVFSPEGSAIETTKAGKSEREPRKKDILVLMPTNEWYTALWWSGEGEDTDIYVDIAKPPMFVNKEWKCVDLEIDVVRTFDGTVTIEDEDEFEEAFEADNINADEHKAALAMTEAIESNLRHRIEPFGLVGRAHFEDAVAQNLRALT